MASGKNLNTRTSYSVNGNKPEIFINAETRAYNLDYADPLTLNFKLMIDYDKEYGLFADESITDSALAYLKRIGETTRYDLLKVWINTFKIFVKQYDFLILGCDGLETVTNAKPWETFSDTDRVVLTVRETSDMLFQSLLTQYRHIWFDDIRVVEVLPANLRRFDINILVYSAGYYNMAVYDVLDNNGLTTEDDPITKIYPTIKKLSEKYFLDNATDTYRFNHHLVSLVDAEIVGIDSGKTFFESLTNEPSGEFVKNNIAFSFRFASYKGMFNNIFGEYDFVKMLAVISAQDKVSNNSQFKDAITERLKSVGPAVGSIFEDLKNNLKSKPNKYLKALISESTVIGNAFSTLGDPNKLAGIVKQGANLGITNLENKYIYSPLTKLNNLVSNNFSTDFNNIYEKYLDNPNSNEVKYQPSKNVYSNTSTKKTNNIRYSSDIKNIYNRNGF